MTTTSDDLQEWAEEQAVLARNATSKAEADLAKWQGQTDTTVCGHQIQHDNSGVGHNWRNVGSEDIPANIVEEIAGEIVDGEQDSCGDFVASNGQHYRW